MTLQEAKKQLKKVGTAHAQGDALRAMYAELVQFHHSFAPKTTGQFYAWLQSNALTDNDIYLKSRDMMRDWEKAWEVIG